MYVSSSTSPSRGEDGGRDKRERRRRSRSRSGDRRKDRHGHGRSDRDGDRERYVDGDEEGYSRGRVEGDYSPDRDRDRERGSKRGRFEGDRDRDREEDSEDSPRGSVKSSSRYAGLTGAQIERMRNAEKGNRKAHLSDEQFDALEASLQSLTLNRTSIVTAMGLALDNVEAAAEVHGSPSFHDYGHMHTSAPMHTRQCLMDRDVL